MSGKLTLAVYVLVCVSVVVCGIARGENPQLRSDWGALGYSRPNARFWPTMYMNGGRLFFLGRDAQMHPVNLNPLDGKITVGNQRFFSPYVDRSVVNYFQWLRSVLPRETWQQLRTHLGQKAPKFWERITGESAIPPIAPLSPALPSVAGVGRPPGAIPPGHTGGPGVASTSPGVRPSSDTGLIGINNLFRSRDATAVATCRSNDSPTPLIGIVNFSREVNRPDRPNETFAITLGTSPNVPGAERVAQRSADGRIAVGMRVPNGVGVSSSVVTSADGNVFRNIRELNPNFGREITTMELRRDPQTGGMQLTNRIDLIDNNGTIRSFVKVCQLGNINEQPALSVSR